MWGGEEGADGIGRHLLLKMVLWCVCSFRSYCEISTFSSNRKLVILHPIQCLILDQKVIQILQWSKYTHASLALSPAVNHQLNVVCTMQRMQWSGYLVSGQMVADADMEGLCFM